LTSDEDDLHFVFEDLDEAESGDTVKIEIEYIAGDITSSDKYFTVLDTDGDEIGELGVEHRRDLIEKGPKAIEEERRRLKSKKNKCKSASSGSDDDSDDLTLIVDAKTFNKWLDDGTLEFTYENECVNVLDDDEYDNKGKITISYEGCR
jgi:hypothetical protein